MRHRPAPASVPSPPPAVVDIVPPAPELELVEDARDFHVPERTKKQGKKGPQARDNTFIHTKVFAAAVTDKKPAL